MSVVKVNRLNFVQVCEFFSKSENCFGILNSKFFIIIIILSVFGNICLPGKVYAQNPELNISVSDSLMSNKSDTTILNSNSNPLIDSLKQGSKTDTTRKAKTPVSNESDIETTINYTAKDSIISSVDRKIVNLYGEAKIIYGEIELEAEHIIIDYTKSTLTASGIVDSTGRRIGFPIFKNGDEAYETKSITYNFKTRKARISEVITRQGEGFIHGETVFKNERNEILSVNNSYTTCNLAHPHFKIISTKTKAIPGDKVVSGPFYLEVNDVPTPLGFAFGMFPSPRRSASGVLIPQYGEETRRGFFLKNGGYFWDLNDYIKLKLTGSIFSKGGYGADLSTNYNKRYNYTGNFLFNLTRNTTNDQIENPVTSNDFRVTWSHTPQTRGSGSFSASVNAATSTYTTNNFLGVNYNPEVNSLDNTSRKLSSTISYRKTFKGTPFSMGISLRHNQDIRTKQVDFQAPDFYAAMRSIYPFKDSKAQILKKLNVAYNVKASNKISNNLGRIASDGTDSIAVFSMSNLSTFFENGKRGLRHTLPISTSFRAFKHFNFSPNFSYEEKWYFEKYEYELDETRMKILVKDTISGFSRVGSFNVGTSVNTRIYGTYLFENRKVQAIRHVINPSASFTYVPDFSNEKYDYYQTFQLANESIKKASRYEGALYGDAPSNESKSIGFSLNNTLEMKVKQRPDSTSKSNEPKYQKISLFRSLSINSAYNLAADSFKLSPISIRANTSVLNNKISLNFNSTIDPYVWDLQSEQLLENGNRKVVQRQRDIYAWKSGNGIGNISSAGVNLSTNLNPRKRSKEESTKDKIQDSDLSDADKQYLIENPDLYVDFDIPWSLRIGYNLRYSQTGFADPSITQTINLSGDLSLTPKWKVGFKSGYDFQNNDFTQSNFSINRDLHCWEMNFNWTPFGRFQSYNFEIRVKSSLLQDLKINRKRSFFDR